MRKDWRDDALCREIDGELFFDDATAHAMAACRMCPVRLECLADSLHSGLESGIWGGISMRKRYQLIVRANNGENPVKLAAEGLADDARYRHKEAS